jgi:hypothetical protein
MMPWLTSLWSGIHHVYHIGILHIYDYNPWSDAFFYLSICKATPGFFALKVMQLLNCFD